MRIALLLAVVLAIAASLAPVQAFAQTPQVPEPAVKIVRRSINPPGPAVGTNYQVSMDVYSRDAGVVRGMIKVPDQDAVISQNPLEQFIGAGQTVTYVFTVRCGISGGLVNFMVEKKREAAPAVPGIEPTREGRTINSALAEGDAKDAVRTTSFAKIFHVRMRQGRTYVIDMVSTQIDPYLRLENMSGRQLAQDDDSGGFPNARIIFQAPEDGTYRVIGTSFAPATGGFTLLIREQ